MNHFLFLILTIASVSAQAGPARPRPTTAPPKQIDSELLSIDVDTGSSAYGGRFQGMKVDSKNRFPPNRIGMEPILKWMPADGKIGDCSVKLSPIYKNDNKTLIGGFDLEIKSATGEVLESTSLNSKDLPIAREEVRRFYSNGEMRPSANYRQIELQQGELSKIENGKVVATTEDERKNYRYLELFVDQNANPPHIIGLNAGRINGVVGCGVVDVATRVAYEKTSAQAKTNANKNNDNTPKMDTKIGNQ